MSSHFHPLLSHEDSFTLSQAFGRENHGEQSHFLRVYARNHTQNLSLPRRQSPLLARLKSVLGSPVGCVRLAGPHPQELTHRSAVASLRTALSNPFPFARDYSTLWESSVSPHCQSKDQPKALLRAPLPFPLPKILPFVSSASASSSYHTGKLSFQSCLFTKRSLHFQEYIILPKFDHYLKNLTVHTL